MTDHTLLSDFLTELGVPHTTEYSNNRFASMPFQSLFGLQKLLQEYCIDSEAIALADKSRLADIQPPFLAKMPEGFVIVIDINPKNVSYLTQGEPQTLPTPDFEDVWTGIAFVAHPSAGCMEPSYRAHRTVEIFSKVKRIALIICTLALLAYLVVGNGIYSHVSTVLIMLLDMAGIVLSFMLLQKTLKIKNRHADRFCAVLQEGGCDHVLEDKASSFFGIFSWSEVGLTYFTVSLLCLLLFPQYTMYLAACNVCCLPFTFWSIWYQKFRVKTWCTMCVSVQCTLWLLFFCYLGGGWLHGIFPLRIEFFALAVTYATVLLAINRLSTYMARLTVSPGTTQSSNF